MPLRRRYAVRMFAIFPKQTTACLPIFKGSNLCCVHFFVSLSFFNQISVMPLQRRNAVHMLMTLVQIRKIYLGIVFKQIHRLRQWILGFNWRCGHVAAIMFPNVWLYRCVFRNQFRPQKTAVLSADPLSRPSCFATTAKGYLIRWWVTAYILHVSRPVYPQDPQLRPRSVPSMNASEHSTSRCETR